MDVAIVGAGVAGLRAAQLLAADGRDVVVLEARDRVGGRLLSQDIGGARFDVGGQWIGPGQRRVWALTRSLGLDTFDTHTEGDRLMWVRGRARRYRGTIPKLDPLSLLALHHAMGRMEKMRARISLERPDEPEATTLDAWQRAHVPSGVARDLVEAAMRVVFGVEARELSLASFLTYAQSAGGVLPLIESEEGNQQTRFRDGAQRLAFGMAERLGDAVRLGCPVRRVHVGDEGVTVVHDGGELRARRVVMALPPALARRVVFEPALPPARRRLIDRMPTGATTKHLLLYERPFWREEGLSGEVVFDEGPVSVTMDNTSFDDSRPCLVAFSVAQPARELSCLPERERERRVVRRLVDAFGSKAAGFTHHVEREWARERWSRGCPVGLAQAGLLREHGDALRAPSGRIHWAGTETAREHQGFIEGALESAERVAEEIRDA
ncbi:MAG: FAD-binding protein [Sandaracinaceae bacterium]|nr:MAG: FAD-binding protein [Sandaracinaceae bacterium]